jgi:hypothetical protein
MTEETTEIVAKKKNRTGKISGFIVAVVTGLFLFRLFFYMLPITNEIEKSLGTINNQLQKSASNLEDIRKTYSGIDLLINKIDILIDVENATFNTLSTLDTKKYPKNIRQSVENWLTLNKISKLTLQRTKQDLIDIKYNQFAYENDRERRVTIAEGVIKECGASWVNETHKLSTQTQKYLNTKFHFWLIFTDETK